MICLEVSVNGKKLATAGLSGHGVVSAIVTSVQRAGAASGVIDLGLGGLDANEGEGHHVHWKDVKLGPGDEVLVRIAEDVPVDPPTRRETAREAGTDQRSVLRKELKQVEKRRAAIRAELTALSRESPGRTRARKKK